MLLPPTRNTEAVSKPKEPHVRVECDQNGYGNHDEQVFEAGFEDKHTCVYGRAAAKQGDEQ